MEQEQHVRVGRVKVWASEAVAETPAGMKTVEMQHG